MTRGAVRGSGVCLPTKVKRSTGGRTQQIRLRLSPTFPRILAGGQSKREWREKVAFVVPWVPTEGQQGGEKAERAANIPSSPALQSRPPWRFQGNHLYSWYFLQWLGPGRLGQPGSAQG